MRQLAERASELVGSILGDEAKMHDKANPWPLLVKALEKGLEALKECETLGPQPIRTSQYLTISLCLLHLEKPETRQEIAALLPGAGEGQIKDAVGLLEDCFLRGVKVGVPRGTSQE